MSTCARFFPKCHIVEFNIFFGFVFRLRRCWKKEKKKDVLIFQKGENLLPGHKKLKDMCVCVWVKVNALLWNMLRRDFYIKALIGNK